MWLSVEVGGTVGDIESLPFMEAIRQLAIEVGRENAMSHALDACSLPSSSWRSKN